MQLKSCEVCGALHVNHTYATCCKNCLAKELQVRDVLRSYIQQHPMPSILELANGTGIRTDVIMRFVRNGSLSVKG